MNYVAGSVVDVGLMLPTTFHNLTTILASYGDYGAFSASSAAATSGTAVSPPDARMGTVVTVLLPTSCVISLFLLLKLTNLHRIFISSLPATLNYLARNRRIEAQYDTLG